MELGEINSGESSKNQHVAIQVEGNIQFLYIKNKISLKSFHSNENFQSDPLKTNYCFWNLNCLTAGKISIANSTHVFW